MFRPASPDTDQLARSLLQKAVRRGFGALALNVAEFLTTGNQTTTGVPKSSQAKRREVNWLKNRVLVFSVEESWPTLIHIGMPGAPHGELKLTTVEAVENSLTIIANSLKRKNAAGLGTLAYEYSKLDDSQAESFLGQVTLQGADLRAIEFVGRAVRLSTNGEDSDFWMLCRERATSQLQLEYLSRARIVESRAGWPWDKAFAYATAFLCTEKDTNSESRASNVFVQEPFPFWIAVDRHTKEGKIAMRQLSREANIAFNPLSWISYYLSSAVVNEQTETLWWDLETKWRLASVGKTLEEAKDIWTTWEPRYRELVSGPATDLESQLIDRRKYRPLSFL